MNRQERKRNPLWLLALFASGVVVGVIAAFSTALSLPDTWKGFSGLVSWATGPIAKDRADIGFVLLLTGVVIFGLALVAAYRRIRERTITPKDLRKKMPEISDDQEATLSFLLQHDITLRAPSDRPPRRSPLALAVLTIAVGAAMLLFNPPQITKKHFPPVALGSNKALASPHSSGVPDKGSAAGQAGGSASEETETGASASASSSTVPLKGEGSSCTCPSGTFVEQGGGREFEPPPEFAEPEEPEEPEFEEPEFEEPEEPEFESVGAEPQEFEFE